MTTGAQLETGDLAGVFEWAAEKQIDLVITQMIGEDWVSFRSKALGYDRGNGMILVSRPEPTNEGQPAELDAAAEFGVALRRGHKKCLFVSRVANGFDGTNVPPGGLLIDGPAQVRSVQRRAYQRVIVPSHRFIAGKIWEGGIPDGNGVSFPLCAGRVANVSVGGVMIDVRADQNPRLQVGDLVGIEITRRPGAEPLIAEGHYRHCVMHNAERVGLGFQFVGLEHDLPGRSRLEEIAQFVSAVRRGV